MAFFKSLARHHIDLAYWIVITTIMAAGGYIFKRFRAKDCVFDITDGSIWHPFVEKEGISPAMIVVGSYILPSVSIVLGTTFKHLLVKHQNGLYFVLAFLHLIDSVGWALVCKPRPDFMARCQPDFKLDPKKYHVQGYGQVKIGEGSEQFTIQTPFLANIQICTASDKEFLRQEGFAAFPSGHVAFVFGCNMYIALWLVRQYSFKLEQKRRSPNEIQVAAVREAKLSRVFYSSLKAICMSSPGRPSLAALIQIMLGLGLSIWVANSRYEDNRHGVFDIVVSAIYGTLIGWLGFKLFQPANMTVASENSETELQQGRRYNSWP